MSTLCPWCSAPPNTGSTCLRCGANYARAYAIKTHGRVTPIEAIEPTESYDVPMQDTWQDASGLERELQFRIYAIPVALCLAIAFNMASLGSALQRIFFTMPVHEFGHAVTAWFCGFAAIPTLWKTFIPEARLWGVSIALSCAIGYLIYRAYWKENTPLIFGGVMLLLIQAFATLGLTPETAHTLTIFGGDGAGMLIAVLLMGSFYFGKETQIYKGSLRWGFLLIGAASFIDIFATWWRARQDIGAIPYGTLDGASSDSMTLVETYGWSLDNLVNRYVTLGACCLVVLALVYAWGLWDAQSAVAAKKLAQKRLERQARQK